jgi:hypothetical protein
MECIFYCPSTSFGDAAVVAATTPKTTVFNPLTAASKAATGKHKKKCLSV